MNAKHILLSVLIVLIVLLNACAPTPSPTVEDNDPTAGNTATPGEIQIPQAKPEKFAEQTVKVLSCGPTDTGLTRINIQAESGEFHVDVNTFDVFTPLVNAERGITGYEPDMTATKCPAGNEVFWHQRRGSEQLELYVSFAPTENDTKVETFWQNYTLSQIQPKFGGKAFDLELEPSPEGYCYVMLRNFWQVSAWNEEDYKNLFSLCVGHSNPNRNSMAYLRSFYGAGSIQPWFHSSGYELEKDVVTTTFMNPPQESEILGTLTPCSTFPISLGYDMRITGITTPGADDIVVDDWQFAAENVLGVQLSFFKDDLVGTASLPVDTYFGFIQADKLPLSEWEEIYHSDPAQQGTVYLYKISGCN